MGSFGKKAAVVEPAGMESAALPSQADQAGAKPAGAHIRAEIGAAPTQKSPDVIRDQVLLRIEPVNAVRMTKQELTVVVDRLVFEIANEKKLLLNQTEQDTLCRNIVDDMIGLGEPRRDLLRVARRAPRGPVHRRIPHAAGFAGKAPYWSGN